MPTATRLGIEPPGRAWLGRIERIRVSDEVPVLLVPQEPGVEQRGLILGNAAAFRSIVMFRT